MFSQISHAVVSPSVEQSQKYALDDNDVKVDEETVKRAFNSAHVYIIFIDTHLPERRWMSHLDRAFNSSLLLASGMAYLPREANRSQGYKRILGKELIPSDGSEGIFFDSPPSSLGCSFDKAAKSSGLCCVSTLQSRANFEYLHKVEELANGLEQNFSCDSLTRK